MNTYERMSVLVSKHNKYGKETMEQLNDWINFNHLVELIFCLTFVQLFAKISFALEIIKPIYHSS